MNPLTNVKNITKLNETELSAGTTNKKSWHDIYKESAWVFIGGLPYELTEGDVLTVFSQYGEIININLVRDKKTGKTKGFCFLCYANQKSTVLAVDNLNGIKVCGRTIRVDHVANYKPPKEDERDDEITKMLKSEGCAPKTIKTEPTDDSSEKKNKKKVKKEKKKKNKKSDKREEVKVKVEKEDPGYHKYEYPNKSLEMKEEHEHRNRKSDSKDCSNHSKSIESTSNEKHYKSNDYHYLHNKNSDSTSKYSSDRKRQNDDDSSSDSSSDSDNDDRKNSKKSSNRDLRAEFSYSGHHSERSKDTENKYRHKISIDDSTGYQKHDKSREYKERHVENRYNSIRRNRRDSSSNSDDGKSSERLEKRTKKYCYEESSTSDKSSSSFYEKQKHRSHDSSKREEYYSHKKHRSK